MDDDRPATVLCPAYHFSISMGPGLASTIFKQLSMEVVVVCSTTLRGLPSHFIYFFAQICNRRREHERPVTYIIATGSLQRAAGDP